MCWALMIFITVGFSKTKPRKMKSYSIMFKDENFEEINCGRKDTFGRNIGK